MRGVDEGMEGGGREIKERMEEHVCVYVCGGGGGGG